MVLPGHVGDNSSWYCGLTPISLMRCQIPTVAMVTVVPGCLPFIFVVVISFCC